MGFSTELLRDSTRTGRPNHPRIVQLAVWYPAVTAGRPSLTFVDYLHAAAAETTTVDTAVLGQRNVDAYCGLLLSRAVPESVVNRWFRAPMRAARDAPSARGQFPLILVAQGNGESAADQAVLGEYLASYGYVVATSPSQSRITGQPESESAVGLAAEDQADDLALLGSALRTRADVAPGPAAALGHSFGARSALLYAMRDSSVAGVVSLDGGIGTATARASYESTRSFRPERAHAPLLHFYEQLDPAMAPDWGTLRALVSAPVWIVATRGLHHHHFTVLGPASGIFPEVRQATGATDQTGSEYARVLELTRAFLDATMRGDRAALVRFAKDSRGVLPLSR